MPLTLLASVLALCLLACSCSSTMALDDAGDFLYFYDDRTREIVAEIQGDGVFVRAPQMTDFADWVAVREQSRDFLTPSTALPQPASPLPV